MTHQPEGTPELPTAPPTFGEAFARRTTIIRALKISAIVGSILCVINQWEAVIGEADFHMLKVILTYIVPFCVSSYSTAASLSDQIRLFEGDSDDPSS